MQAFLCTHRPRSVNARNTDKFQEHIREAYHIYCIPGELIDAPLYGVVYYFHSRHNQLDADNLSKPVWDALEGVVYEDDLIIKLRHAGIVDLRGTDINLFDLSRMPDTIAADFIAMIGSKDYILYVEFGQLSQDMFLFGRETNKGV